MKFFRLLSLALAIAFFATSVVPAGAEASVLTAYDMNSTPVSEAFDKFNYAMNVEWDQKDEGFKAKAEKQFIEALEGVSAEELQAYIRQSITDATLRADFLRLIEAMRAQNLSSGEAAAVAQDWAEKNSALGLSFAGKGGTSCGRLCKTVTLIIVVVIVHQIWRSNRSTENEEVEYEYTY